MARPRKSDGEKLVTVTIGLTPSHYDQLAKEARERDVKVSALLRRLLERYKKTEIPAMANTSAH